MNKLFAWFAGKWLKNKVKLEDGPVDKKRWWASKTIWAAVYVITRAAYEAARTQFTSLPEIPVWAETLISTVAGIQVVKARLNTETAKPIA